MGYNLSVIIKRLYLSQGYNFAGVQSKIEEISENRINLFLFLLSLLLFLSLDLIFLVLVFRTSNKGFIFLRFKNKKGKFLGRDFLKKYAGNNIF